MKCMTCSCDFDPTPEEQSLLDDSPCSYIPFCSQKCCLIFWKKIPSRIKGCGPNTLFHQGPIKSKAEIGHGKIIPTKPGVYRYRIGGFSYMAHGDCGGLLPSEMFFGKASTRVLDEGDVLLGGDDGDFFNFEGE